MALLKTITLPDKTQVEINIDSRLVGIRHNGFYVRFPRQTLADVLKVVDNALRKEAVSHLNEGHQVELLQTLFICSNNLEDYVLGSESSQDLRFAPVMGKIHEALALLGDAYQLAAELELGSLHNNGV